MNISAKIIRIKNALRYLYRGDFKGLYQRFIANHQESSRLNIQTNLVNSVGVTWGILTTPHTISIDKLIAEHLAIHGINSEITTLQPPSYKHDLYFVLCPQMFSKLPPPNKCIAFQLEQSISDRWFTEKYLDILKNSLAVLDYSLTNIKYLASKGIQYPQISYLPLGASLNIFKQTTSAEKKFDFIFYGDNLSSPRRQRMLNALSSKFNVKICNDLFGEEMASLICQAKAVINIHYYENALLEMSRIQECISLGVPVLSETTMDQHEYPELNGAVHFFKEGSADDMIIAATALLKNTSITLNSLDKAVEQSAKRFTYMFDRFLVSLGIVPITVLVEAPIYLEKSHDFIGLSLPETIKRRNKFIENKPDDCIIFDGIRNARGWIGCGSSYSALARHAIKNNYNQIMIIEDDIFLPENFQDNLKIVKEYLQIRKDHWDIFSGMMASVHKDSQVLNVDIFRGIKFVTIDHMTSAVCNIYNKSALEMLANWDPIDTNVETNTIDRYLEAHDNLRVIVAIPFIAGHREELDSTLWGFNNMQYTPMINAAETRINQLAETFQFQPS